MIFSRIDRYILKQFLLTLVFSLLALYAIFLVVSLLENLDEFIAAEVSIYLIVKYYLYFFPGIVKILLPVAMLISILFSVGKMSTNNETTAMKAGGMSLYRMMAPLVLLSTVISFGHLYFNGWVVPEANKSKLQIDREHLKKEQVSTTIRDLYLMESPQEILSMRYYRPMSLAGEQVNLETYSGGIKPRLTKSLQANEMVWDSTNSSWLMKNVILRKFDTITSKTIEIQRYDSLFTDISITNSEIEKLVKTTNEMDFDETKEYIELLKKGGKDVRQKEIDYYGEYAYPFANIIVVLFGVPFASIKKKGGVAMQITAALVISFFYLIFTKLTQSISASLAVDAMYLAWFANFAFFLFAVYIIYRINT
ncbi:MAG: LptF/LptG family permease [Candidatus Kapaibacteriales bacterium]